jgi:hypothetical protein
MPPLVAQLAQIPNSQSLPAIPGAPPDFWKLVFELVGALAILVLGWIIAMGLAGVVRGLLSRTKIDDRIANLTTGQQAKAASVANIAATVVFWIIMILAVVAALNVFKLTTVSEPLNNFLNQIFAYLPRLGGAAIMVAVAWLVATVSKMLVMQVARSFALDDRLSETTDGAGGQFILSETIGNALYWFVFLFFLPLILDVLGLQGPLQPVQNLLNDFLAALPNILKAVVIAVVGWLIARIVRGIVANLLAALGADQIGSKVGLTRGSTRQSLSWIVGTIIYVLILIPTAVAALEALRIQSISAPASAMLNQILTAIPQIFTAALILVFGYVIGQFVNELITNLLTGIGFNNVLNWLGLQQRRESPIPPPPPADLEEGSLMLIEPDRAGFGVRTPSEIVGIVLLVVIMLFAAVAATNILGIPALTAIVSGLLVLLGQVVVGLVIFGVGLYLANLAYGIVSSSGTSQARILGQTARIAIIALVAAMALQQIGIAPNIINLAFGLLLGAISVAIALAFGLGGRDVAAEQLRDWLSSFKREKY